MKKNGESGKYEATGWRVRSVTTMDGPIDVDWSALAYDPHDDKLAFSLPHATSSHDETSSLSGPLVRYTLPAGGTDIIDGFVYVVADGKGGKSTAIVTILVN